jgi:hypothetical protein
MSLVKLLSVGRSFAGAQHVPGRYKMSRDCRLPQFGSTRRMETPPEPSGSDEPKSAPGADPCRAGRVQGKAGRLGRILSNPVKFLWQVSWGARKGRKPRPLVQPELALENVRVVRNDLNDGESDAMSRARAVSDGIVSPANQSNNTARSSEAGVVWNRLTARLFAVGRSRLE